MALKPLRPCRHPGCPALTRDGYCPKHKPAKAAAGSPPSGMAGITCRSGRTTCGRLSSCGSRFAGSVPGSIPLEIRAAVPGPRWWTTSSPIGETGCCLLTLPITRVCASTTTTRRRPRNRRKNAGRTREIDRANALEATSARRYACAHLGMCVTRRAGQAGGL